MSTNTKVEGLIDALRTRIHSGEFGNEGRLPSFRSLATEYNTTQETMNKTMQALQAEGLLTSMGAKGVFVNKTDVRLLAHTQNFFQYLKEQVQDPFEEYIEKPSLIKAPAEIARILGVAEGSIVFRRFKKQGTNQVLFRLEEVFYPKSVLTDEAIEKMTKNASFLPFELIKDKFGIFIASANEKILCRLPSAYEQDLLKIVRTNPVIDIKRVCYTKDKKKILTYSRMILNANHFLLSYDYEVDLWKK